MKTLITLIYDDLCGKWAQTNHFPKNKTFSMGIPFKSYDEKTQTNVFFMCIEIEVELTLKQI